MHSLATSASRPGSVVGSVRVLLALTLFTSACSFERYEPAPLDAESLLREIETDRHAVGETLRTDAKALSLAEAAALLPLRSPRWRDARADFEVAAARASIDTPLPNPALQVGPLVGIGAGVGPRRVVPALGLSFRIPLAGKRDRADQHLRTLAEAARIDSVATLREVGLELREKYANWQLAEQTVQVQRSLVESSARALEVAHSLVEAGVAAALDVASFRLDHARERAHLLAAEEARITAEQALAEELALDASALGEPEPLALATLPDPPPSLENLREMLLESNLELARLRAKYAVAESGLRVQIGEQYPDLVIGASAEGDTGDRRTVLGLGLGIEIPLFDRNQQGIATAHAARESARIHHETAAQRALSELENAYRAYCAARARVSLLSNEVEVAAEENVDVARRALSAGSASALQVLDTMRSLREVQLETLSARRAAHNAWARLERVVGVPIDTDVGERR